MKKTTLNLFKPPSLTWDYDNLEVDQVYELYAAVASYVAFPGNQIQCETLRDNLIEGLTKKNIRNKRKRELTAMTQGSLSLLDKEATRRILAHRKMASFLCRMIVHHSPKKKRTASINRAYTLTERWAGRNRRSGLSKTYLKEYWTNFKGVVPLSAAFAITQKRAKRKLKRSETGKNNVRDKIRLATFLGESMDVLQVASTIQKTLLDYNGHGGSNLIAESDLLFFPESLNLKPKIMSWASLNERDQREIKILK